MQSNIVFFSNLSSNSANVTFSEPSLDEETITYAFKYDLLPDTKNKIIQRHKTR
ncbi:hypothetical protein BN1013_01957 [Candidatus Rubidus massiliensis]|nr:hypothetical protein BN1013_01957 [Candidatus Rubidus massiliensis]